MQARSVSGGFDDELREAEGGFDGLDDDVGKIFVRTEFGANEVDRNGPSEFFITGTLKNWSIVDELHKIKAPTLLINGKYDEAQDECVEPYSKLIPDVKWVKFANSSHTPLWEEREEYMKVVHDFLSS